MRIPLLLSFLLLGQMLFCQESEHLIRPLNAETYNFINATNQSFWKEIVQNNFGTLLATIVALATLFIGMKVIRKPLIEKDLINKLSEIQKANQFVAIESQKLIDEHFGTLQKQGNQLTKAEVDVVYKKLSELYYNSHNCSSQVHTFCLLLKRTLELLLLHWHSISYGQVFKPKIKTIESTVTQQELSSLIVSVLTKVKFYCTQVLEVPTSLEETKLTVIKNHLKHLVTHGEINKLRQFNQGEILEPNSSIYVFFADSVNSTCYYNFYIKRAAFESLNSNHIPFLIQLYGNEIYAPPTIIKKAEHNPHQFDFALTLIGFRVFNQHSTSSRVKKKFVEFNYTNFGNAIFLNEGFTLEHLRESYYDDFGKKAKLNLENIEGFIPNLNSLTISITFEYEYCNSLFKKNKNQIKLFTKST